MVNANQYVQIRLKFVTSITNVGAFMFERPPSPDLKIVDYRINERPLPDHLLAPRVLNFISLHFKVVYVC